MHETQAVHDANLQKPVVRFNPKLLRRSVMFELVTLLKAVRALRVDDPGLFLRNFLVLATLCERSGSDAACLPEVVRQGFEWYRLAGRFTCDDPPF